MDQPHAKPPLQLFVQAVDSGSFTAAARHLGIPKSTV
ncbi:LysR family transcriptional regulator, partial [Rhizobium ruizarguesonis]